MLLIWAFLILGLVCSAQLRIPTEAELNDYVGRKVKELQPLFESKQAEKLVRALEELRGQSLLRAREDFWSNYVLYNLACAYSLLGKKDQAIDTLREAAESGYSNVAGIEKDSDFDSIRREPGYQQLVQRMKARAAFWNGPALRSPYRPDLTDDEKVAGLSKFWSEVKFNFANFDLLPGLDWDRLYLEHLPKVRQTKSTIEYYRELRRLCALLRDGHTNVYFPDPVRDETLSRPFLRTQRIEDVVVISEVHDPELKAAGIQVGMEVVTVDGIPVAEYAEQFVKPYESASTPQNLAVRTYQYALLNGPKDKPAELGLRLAGGPVTVKSVARHPGNQSGRDVPPWKRLDWRELPGKIAYVALNTFGEKEIVDDFDKVFPSIEPANALILDVRRNGGGSSGFGHAILGYLTDRPIPTSRWKTRDYRPSFRVWTGEDRWFARPGGQVSPNGKKLFQGPVAVLSGPETFSAAEDFLVAFELMQRGSIIGEPSGGSTGQPLYFDLPGGGTARVCTKRDAYPDGRDFVGVGVQPGILVRPTLSDFRAGRDTVLEAAAAHLKK